MSARLSGRSTAFTTTTRGRAASPGAASPAAGTSAAAKVAAQSIPKPRIEIMFGLRRYIQSRPIFQFVAQFGPSSARVRKRCGCKKGLGARGRALAELDRLGVSAPDPGGDGRHLTVGGEAHAAVGGVEAVHQRAEPADPPVGAVDADVAAGEAGVHGPHLWVRWL